MTNFENNIKLMDRIFEDNFENWYTRELAGYLDTHFDSWLINPLDEKTVEVFVEGDFGDFEEEVEENLFDESMHMVLSLMRHLGVEDKDGYLTELVPDYALEHIYIYPISELGDEPLTDKNLIFSLDFFD